MMDMPGSQDGTFSLLRLSMGGSKKAECSKRVRPAYYPLLQPRLSSDREIASMRTLGQRQSRMLAYNLV
jgi:hypothetical protein